MSSDQAIAYALDDAGSPLAKARQPGATPPPAADTGRSALSARELEVVAHVARGHTNREISRDLYLSEHTVASHVRSILSKIGASSRAEAAAYAVRRGLAGPDPGPTKGAVVGHRVGRGNE